MSALVVPFHPVRQAFRELCDLGRPDLRHQSARLVVSEVRAGRDGMAVMKLIAQHRRAAKRQDGVA
ncbi:hypothetical protein [Pseudoxanthomonas indica]|uniref:Uncharacterized protein n=1 Tax=Pseudoxanthomonas indica TaxID=428993 RepID=A0A1T5K1T4_9GAMM|nr:hypothetical protein [Pseudoxanthomonas indica]GGD45860.1 hypothetical protein GCM10007235_17310 [Pseudoxanthomonas indica]SKC57439.1 hypothetical protein SAMN06296058_1269 [Pseudoxanthomonas indica]